MIKSRLPHRNGLAIVAVGLQLEPDSPSYLKGCKTMKHSLFAAALLALALSACGQKEAAVATPAAPAVAEPAPAPAAPAPSAAPADQSAAPADAAKPADGAAPATPDASLKQK